MVATLAEGDIDPTWLDLIGVLGECSARITLLEETLRGALEEKQKMAAAMRDHATWFVGRRESEAYETAASEYEQAAAWLESALRGDK